MHHRWTPGGQGVGLRARGQGVGGRDRLLDAHLLTRRPSRTTTHAPKSNRFFRAKVLLMLPITRLGLSLTAKSEQDDVRERDPRQNANRKSWTQRKQSRPTPANNEALGNGFTVFFEQKKKEKNNANLGRHFPPLPTPIGTKTSPDNCQLLNRVEVN
ncbi:hypothetical protein CDAR_411411 [Caerostris darwini]|uniref:Uncharacterized protein n=1 Tax=Caerostris darwini TaxID=1538125 RepID=A0AAV4SHS1_9ARAC|nr:hypothetical protein CDAR_411411 [Caerostris darwini]